MPWNGSGQFTRNNGQYTGATLWAATKAGGRKIRTDDHDSHDEDLATGLENCLTRDGQNAPTANLPMNAKKHTGVADATADTEYATKGQMDAGDAASLAAATALLTAAVFETGDIKASAVSAVPTGWLECDGSAVSRTTYSALFTAIGTTYGVGDGSTTFNVPDFRGRVVIGASATKAMGTTGGAETHTLTVDEMPSHTHGSAGAHQHGIPVDDPGPAEDTSGHAEFETYMSTSAASTSPTETAGSHEHASAGGGNAHSIMQPYGVARVIIKT